MITGNTKIFAIIRDPVFHVRTPEVFNELFSRTNTDSILVAIHVAADGLEAVLNGFRGMKNFGGFVATAPHKSRVAALCDEIGDSARAIGAVNAVRREADGRLIGDIFDGAGFLAGLRAQGHDPAGRRVLLVGAGGAAAAIAFALCRAGVASLTTANRTRSKADAIVARVNQYLPGSRIEVGVTDPTGHDLIINATPLGLRAGDHMPLETEWLRPAMTVAEVIMKPEITPLLAAAKAAGCTVHYGRHMLDEQVSLIHNFFEAKDS